MVAERSEQLSCLPFHGAFALYILCLNHAKLYSPRYREFQRNRQVCTQPPLKPSNVMGIDLPFPHLYFPFPAPSHSFHSHIDYSVDSTILSRHTFRIYAFPLARLALFTNSSLLISTLNMDVIIHCSTILAPCFVTSCSYVD